MKRGEIVQFRRFRIDPLSRAVMREDSPVALSRRAFDVLLYLVQNPGRVVTKEELLKSVWPDASVDENKLMQSISALRKALEERPGENRFITTLPGRGYQFIAPASLVGVREAALEPEEGTGAPEVSTGLTTDERRPRLSRRWLSGRIAVRLPTGCQPAPQSARTSA